MRSRFIGSAAISNSWAAERAPSAKARTKAALAARKNIATTPRYMTICCARLWLVRDRPISCISALGAEGHRTHALAFVISGTRLGKGREWRRSDTWRRPA